MGTVKMWPFNASDKIDNIKREVPFGKYRGKTFYEIAEIDSDYLKWLLHGTDFGEDHAEEIRRALHKADLQRLRGASKIRLTEHQQTACDMLLRAIEQGQSVVRLEGGAGYGKSTVTREIAAGLLRKGLAVRACAVSYVAAQVLAEQLDPINVRSATLARTLKFTVIYENGVQQYAHSSDTLTEVDKILGPGNALIVDECSMIADTDARLLFDTATRRSGHLILVGDSRQLPPVKQNHRSLCCGALTGQVSELTIPMRYSRDSHLYRIEHAMRTNPHDCLYDVRSPLALPSHELMLAADMHNMFERYCRYYRNDPIKKHRMLLFRRQDVTDANNRIRKNLFGSEADVVEQDEQLMILRTGDTPYDSDDTVRYYSGQTFHVLEKWREEYHFSIGKTQYHIPHWSARFDDDHLPVRIIFGVTENRMDTDKLGGPEYQCALAAARQYGLDNGEWSFYRQLLDDFVRVAYQYATSVHRCQGQTVDYAYCHPTSLFAVGGILGQALTYVACTRAKQHLTVL